MLTTTQYNLNNNSQSVYLLKVVYFDNSNSATLTSSNVPIPD